jgi:hypothetical protein
LINFDFYHVMVEWYEMMQVKGSAIAPMSKFITEKHGDYGYKKWLEALSPQAAGVLRAYYG